MVVTRTGMVLVEFFVLPSQVPMVATVRSVAGETFFVRLFMGFSLFPVDVPVFRMITGMTIVFIMSESRSKWRSKRQNTCGENKFIHNRVFSC